MAGPRAGRIVALAAVAAAPLMSGCSPAPVGEVALARTADGDLHALVLPCGEVYDTVYLQRDAGEYGEDIGTWKRKQSFDEGAHVDISRPARSTGWKTLVAWDGHFEPAETYYLLASTSDLHLGTSALWFDAEIVDGLEAGELLTQSEGDTPTASEESVDEWAERACEDDSWF